MSEKMMSFEECLFKIYSLDSPFQWSDAELERLFRMARIGTIPAEGAIVVPDAGEWPEDADGFAGCFFTNANTIVGNGPDKFPFRFTTIIPRPVPEWTPKIGDAVFAKDGKDVTVGNVDGIDEDLFSIRCLNGRPGLLSAISLKPFSPSKIGLPWSEI